MLSFSRFVEEKKLDIDIHYIELFETFKKDWILLTPEIIKKFLTKERGKYAIPNFHRQVMLRSDYKEGVDYKESSVEEKNEYCKLANLSNSQNKNKKLYFVSLKCFKLLLLSSTRKKRAKEYFVNLEIAITEYIKYQASVEKKTLLDEILYLKSLRNVKSHIRLQSIKEIENTRKIGCVYFIKEENDSCHYKIGFTYNLPTRLAQLQTANLRKLIVHKSILCMYPEKVEEFLHKKYEHCKIRGEWFKIMIPP